MHLFEAESDRSYLLKTVLIRAIRTAMFSFPIRGSNMLLGCSKLGILTSGSFSGSSSINSTAIFC
jgi:hypothetical protein